MPLYFTIDRTVTFEPLPEPLASVDAEPLPEPLAEIEPLLFGIVFADYHNDDRLQRRNGLPR